MLQLDEAPFRVPGATTLNEKLCGLPLILEQPLAFVEGLTISSERWKLGALPARATGLTPQRRAL